MTERQLGHVLFRLLGLWLVAEAIGSAGDMYFGWMGLPSPPEDWEIVAVFAPHALLLATALVVWSWAGSLANRVFSDEPAFASSVSTPTWTIYRAVASALGVYLVASSLPSVVYWLAALFQTSAGTPERNQLFGIQGRAQGLSLLAQCLVGVVLYVGPASSFPEHDRSSSASRMRKAVTDAPEAVGTALNRRKRRLREASGVA
jgi:hypothetical protein